jgi:hypothetical protein
MMNRHRLTQPRRRFWRVLRDAGLVLVVIMGIVLLAIALAVGFAVGMGLIG